MIGMDQCEAHGLTYLTHGDGYEVSIGCGNRKEVERIGENGTELLRERANPGGVFDREDMERPRRRAAA